MPDDATAPRAALQRQQVLLLQALVQGGHVPESFAPDQIARTAESLRNKRQRMIEKTWPLLASALGSLFPTRFADFSQEQSIACNSNDDGLCFARWLKRRGELPAVCTPALLAAELRRGFPARFERMPGAWCIGIRLPGRRVRVRVIGSVVRDPPKSPGV